jgi:hypothetical protein
MRAQVEVLYKGILSYENWMGYTRDADGILGSMWTKKYQNAPVRNNYCNFQILFTN